MEIKISIAMAAYNGEKYIKEQLDSYCKQTVLPDELVVCDDCSTDSTLEILKEFQKNAPFKTIIIRNEKNLGSTKGFEIALRNTTGDWICLSDQDDVWKENKIEEYIKAIKDSDEKVGLIYCDYEIVDENLNPIENINQKRIPDYKNENIFNKNASNFLLTHYVICGSAMILERKAAFQTLPFSTPFHDNWLAWAISVNNKIKFINKKLHLYRQHNNQQIGLGIARKKDKKNFVQKYIYDFEKFKRRKTSRINSLKENFLFYKAAVEYLKQNNIYDNLLGFATKGLIFYETRQKVANRSRLKRLVTLFPLFIKGYYKTYEYKRAYSEFRRDIEFPAIEIK